LNRIRDEYINTGKVRFIFRNYATLGPESVKAAEGSECAADQDAFWTYHDILFEDQVKNRSRISDDHLITLAQVAGLDTSAFKKCLETAGHDDAVIETSIKIKSRGVRGVPGFMINGQYIAGTLPYEEFQRYIEQALEEVNE
jgi:protein-disulfide isomerase